VVRAFELDVGDGGSFQAGEEDTPEAVTDGGAEAALEGLGHEFPIGVGGNVRITDNPGRQFQTTPTNSHVKFSFCDRSRIAEGSRPDHWGPSVLPPRREALVLEFRVQESQFRYEIRIFLISERRLYRFTLDAFSEAGNRYAGAG
jgi:hypothetical protein